MATNSGIAFEKTEDPQQISLNRIIQAAGVSRRAYFYWCSGGRATNPAPAEFNELILAQIKIEFEQSNRTRGTHSMTTAINVWLERQGLPKVNHKRIYRLMRQSGMVSVIRKKRPGYHKTQADYIAENTLNGDFERKGINEVWATDSTFVTYGKHNEMGIWLCGVIDLYSHEILGSSLSKTQTTVAAKEAFDQAYVSFPYAKPLVHSDRGSAYTSNEFRNYLRDKSSGQSMSRPGTPSDNAVMESFWAQFKTEWLDQRPKRFETLEELAEYIQAGLTYFATKRRTVKNNGLTPKELRNQAA